MGVEETVMEWVEAMRAVRDGLSVRRQDWEDEGVVVALHHDRLSIRIGGEWKDWIVSSADMLARDWTV